VSKKLIHCNKLDKGGHFAAREQPELFTAEMRAASLDHLVGNSDPTHDRVIHSVDCFPRLRVMPVVVILKLMSPFA
jgi:hypothetical protein